ncbi:MAG: dihydrodipicolinate synthase family protein [Myxococcota bacterium]|nr:dihydrodipicolinate synthase family protein [Myxococcota bacterium]
MSEPDRLRGIFCPNVVPLDAAGEIDEGGLRAYVDWLIDHGVHGLYPNGSTGEFTRFTADERRRIIEIVVEQAAGRVPVLAGAAEANVRETLRACEHYARVGADAVAIVSPYYYSVSPEGVWAYFDEIGRNTPIDVTLYNIPMFASPIDLPTIRRLAGEHARIRAIKDSSGDVPAMMAMIDAVRPERPDFSFMTGWDSCLLPMLLLGCDGGTNATSGVAPELTRKLFDLVQAGANEEARPVQARITQLFDTLFAEADFPEGFRLGVRARGVEVGPGRTPRAADARAEDGARVAALKAIIEESLVGAIA